MTKYFFYIIIYESGQPTIQANICSSFFVLGRTAHGWTVREGQAPGRTASGWGAGAGPVVHARCAATHPGVSRGAAERRVIKKKKKNTSPFIISYFTRRCQDFLENFF